MAHSAVLTSNLDGATPLELVAGPTEGIWLAPEGEGLFVPPAYTETFASAPGTEGGIRTRSDPENVVGTGKVYFTGATQAAFWANIATFEQTIEQCRKYGGTLVYEPVSGPTITYEIESAHLLSLPQRGYHLGQRHAESDFELVFKPYGLLAESTSQSVRVSDHFSYDSIGLDEWTFDSGSGTLAVTGGQLIPSSTAVKNLYRSVVVADCTVRLKFHTGTATKQTTSVVAKRLDASNLIYAELANTTLRIFKYDAAVSTQLATTNYTNALNTNYWLELVCSGDALTARVYIADPDGGAAAVATVSHTLVGANATKFGSGIYGNPGLSLTPATTLTGWAYTEFSVSATLFQIVTRPLLTFEIPPQDGSVDALVEIHCANINEDSHHFYFFEWGMESAYWSTDASWPLLIDSADLTALESATTTGADGTAYGGTGMQQTLSTTSKGIGTVTSQHVGRFHVKGRVQASATTVYVRLAYSYRGGGTEFLPWVTLPGSGSWYELDLGVVNIPPPERGAAHDAIFSIYAKASSGTPTCKIDYFKFFPAERYGVAGDNTQIPHTWLAGLKIAHDGVWRESGFGTDKYDRVPTYAGSYLRMPVKGGRFALFEAGNNLLEQAQTTGFLDDELRVTTVNVTPRVALLGE